MYDPSFAGIYCHSSQNRKHQRISTKDFTMVFVNSKTFIVNCWQQLETAQNQSELVQLSLRSLYKKTATKHLQSASAADSIIDHHPPTASALGAATAAANGSPSCGWTRSSAVPPTRLPNGWQLKIDIGPVATLAEIYSMLSRHPFHSKDTIWFWRT